MMLTGALSPRAYWLLADAQARAQARPFNLPVCWPCGYGYGHGRGRGYARVGLAPVSAGQARGTRVGLIPANPNGYDLTFSTSLFQGDHDVERTMRAIGYMMDALVSMNVDYLREHPETPWLYQSGVRYQEEKEGEELWQDIPKVLERGVADCEDLAGWRVGEMIVRENMAARPHVSAARQPDGKYLFHIRAQRPDGSLEDPSQILGMP